MVHKRARSWYVVYQIGNNDPCLLISAISSKQAQLYAETLGINYKIMVAKVWVLAKVFSGVTYHLPQLKAPAPNSWTMQLEHNLVSVIILN